MRFKTLRLDNFFEEREKIRAESRARIEGKIKSCLLTLLREAKPVRYFSLPTVFRDEDGTLYSKECIEGGYVKGIHCFAITSFSQEMIDSQLIQNLRLREVMYLARKVILQLYRDGIIQVTFDGRNAVSKIRFSERSAISVSLASKNRPLRKRQSEFPDVNLYGWGERPAWNLFLSPRNVLLLD